MSKYLAVFRFKFLRSLQFRSEIGLWVILDLLPFVTMFLVLKSIFIGVDTVRGFTLSEFILYYFFVAFIQGASSSHFEGFRIEQIKMGKIDFFLTKPLSYFQEILFQDLASKTFFLFLFIPIATAIFLATQHAFDLTFPTVSLSTIIFLLYFVAFAYLIEFCIALAIVLVGFWFEGSQGLEHFKWIVLTLASGSMIPTEFMPSWLRSTTNLLPFQYMYSYPISLLLGKTQLTWNALIIPIITILFATIVIKLFYQQALKRYASSGG